MRLRVWQFAGKDWQMWPLSTCLVSEAHGRFKQACMCKSEWEGFLKSLACPPAKSPTACAFQTKVPNLGREAGCPPFHITCRHPTSRHLSETKRMMSLGSACWKTGDVGGLRRLSFRAGSFAADPPSVDIEVAGQRF